jgi:aminomethyltransferase
MRADMHKTPLHEEHIALGAKMAWFAGWDMPIQYSGIIEEHMAVRRDAGAFDVSHMGDFIIAGTDADQTLNDLSTNDVANVPIGKCIYTHMLDEKGMILDDTIICRIGEQEFFMVPNAATISKMRRWVEGHLHGQVFHDMSANLAAIAVQGPTAKEVLARLTSADLGKLKPFWGDFVRLDKIPGSEPDTPMLKGRMPVNGLGAGARSFLSRTGYTGEDGFEIVVENADAVPVWRAVLAEGRQFGLVPVGLGARDTLRLEKGLLLSGTDFDGEQTSVQTGPSWVIDWNHDFTGKEVLAAQRSSGAYDKLVCMLANGRGIPRHGYDILSDGDRVGKVTSGTLSPVLRKGIAMGYVPLKMAIPGTEVTIMARETELPCEIVRPPFVRRD